MQALTPYLIGFAAMSCYAVLTPLAKKIQLDYPPFAFVAMAMSLLAVAAGLFSIFFEKDFSFLSVKGSSWVGIFGFSLINLIGFVLYLLAIKKMPAAEYQMIYILSPIVVAFFAFLLLGEPFKMRYLAGLAVMGLGLFIALYDSAKS